VKYPIAWHQKCLANQKASLEREEERLKLHVAAVERQRGEHAVYKFKIERAISEGRDGFDSVRFNVDRPKCAWCGGTTNKPLRRNDIGLMCNNEFHKRKEG
jgi:hypothetical protein